MKSALVRFAGSTGLAVGIALAMGGVASASTKADCDHGQNQSSYHQVSYDRGSQYNQADYSYRTNDRRGDNDRDDFRQYGFMYRGTWYNYNQVGYWCEGRWVPYSSSWSGNDWSQWAMQGCL